MRAIALPGAVVQIAVATAIGLGLARWWDWNTTAGIVFGLALSVASTVVLLRALAMSENFRKLVVETTFTPSSRTIA